MQRSGIINTVKSREATPADFDLVRRLYRDVWGYNRPERFDRWRYIMSSGKFCPTALASNGDKLVGAYMLWPVSVSVGSKNVSAAQSMDTMTHPENQGQGIFTNLANACYQIAETRGIQILYGFPNPLSYPGFVRKLGWNHIGDITHWVRPIKPSLYRHASPLKRVAASFAATVLPRGRVGGFELSFEAPPQRALTSLLDQWRSEQQKIRIVRDVEWLSWRYAEDTDNDYKFVSAYQSGELRAVAIWGMHNEAWGTLADKRAHLVDLLGEDPAALETVLAHLYRVLRHENVVLLETLSNVERVCIALKKVGFLRHRKAPFIVKTLGDKGYDVDVSSIDNWQIMGSDVDTF